MKNVTSDIVNSVGKNISIRLNIYFSI